LLPGSGDGLAGASGEPPRCGEVFEVEAVSEEPGGCRGADAPNPGNVVGEVADQGRTVAPLIRGHMESPGYLFRSDDSLAGWPGGVEDLHPVAQELVEVAVPAEDADQLPQDVSPAVILHPGATGGHERKRSGPWSAAAVFSHGG
jgi:hypothetical protein